MVYNSSKQWIGEVRSISSLQWKEEYAGTGEVKLVCAANSNNRNILQNGMLLRNSERPQTLAVVKAVEIDDNRETANMTVRAVPTVALLADRVLMHTLSEPKAEIGMLTAINNNIRGLPFKVSASKGYNESFGGQISWGNVLDAVMKIAQQSGLGFHVVAANDLSETFEVYKGIDRTDPENEGYVGFFGDAAGNIAGIRFKKDCSMNKNVAVVAGEGEGTARQVIKVDLSEDLFKRELFVDASDIQSTYTVENHDGSTTEYTLTPDEYKEQLRVRGLQKLAEQSQGVSLAVDLAQSMMLFGIDYDIGDILPLRIEKYGIAANVRLSNIVLIYEQTKSVKATLEVVV